MFENPPEYIVSTVGYTQEQLDAAVEAAMSELQHKYDELLEHYTWQGNQYMEAMRNKASEIEAAIEATKEKAAKVCDEFAKDDDDHNLSSCCAAAIRSMK